MRAEFLATVLSLLLGLTVVGCTRDLTRVHTPDLLEIDENAALPSSKSSATTLASQVTAPSEWRIYSSLREWGHLIDSSMETVAYSDYPQGKDQYILVDLGEVCTLSQVIQKHPETGGFPRRYRVDVAGEHNFPYTLAYLGKGQPGVSEALLTSGIQARFLRITLLETSEEPWQITNLEVR